MAGIDYHNDWPYHFSYLSAFAPPFTVNKSNSNVASAPFMYLAEPADAMTSNLYPFGSNYYSELDSAKTYGCPRAVDPRTAQLLHLGSPSAPPASNFGILPSSEGGSSFWPKETHIFGLIAKDTSLNQAEVDQEDNNFSNSKKLYPMPISQITDCFDEGQLSVHQDSESNSEMCSSSWNIAKDVVDFVFRKTPEIENADANVDNLSFKGFNSVENFVSPVVRFNPTFDSPYLEYWKGAPAAHFSLCEVSDALHREFMKMSDEPHNFSHDTDTESDVLSSVDSVSERKISGVPLNNSIFDHGSWSSYLNKMEENNFVSPKIHIHQLVKTLHNTSEVLLDHCMNDTCEMNEQCRNELENVISNLHACVLKNAEEIIPAPKVGFPLSNSGKHDGESPKAQQNTSFEKPHLTEVGPEHTSRTRDDDIEIKKADKRAKAMKSFFSENFHDDEEPGSQAKLCPINDRAPYNKMMIGMDKYSCKQTYNAKQSKPELPLKLRLSQSLVAEVNSFNLEKFSPELNEPITSTPEGSGTQNEDSFFLDSPVSHRSEEAEDFFQDSPVSHRSEEAEDFFQDSPVSHRSEEAEDFFQDSHVSHRSEEAEDFFQDFPIFHRSEPCINTGSLEDLMMVSQPFALASEGIDDHKKTPNDKDNFSHDSPIPTKEPTPDHETSSISSKESLEEFVFIGRLDVNPNSAAHHSDDDWEQVEDEEFAGHTLNA
ncbi:hypothetical protein G2W53_030584 [Senna tora]|uniref:Uncharacterized protein n=1 Tax=Senna tora TaxID=362788 RepID=A0A834T7P6_9FABA|nr:hypothetical protein G2W53_030584 [Senna tora]